VPSDFERMLRDVPATFPRPDAAAKQAARRRVFPRRRLRGVPPRRLSLLTAAAVCAAATIGFTAGHWLVPAQGKAATAVTLGTTEDTFTVGVGTFTLFGSLTSGRAHEGVVIEARECGVHGTFHLIGGASTVAGGAFGAELNRYPERTTEYRARWRDGFSAPVTVSVRPRIDVQYLDGTLHVQVWAGAVVRNRRAILQIFDRSGSPQTLRTFLIRNPGYGTGGDATVRVKIPRHRIIRVVLPQIGPCFSDGISPPVTT
jgi:hypothetical protein